MPLVLKRGAVGGATLRMSIDSFGGVDREDYCNLFDVQDYGCLVTLASDESLSIHGGSSSGAGANSRLGWTCGDDRLFTLAIIGRQNVIRGPDERSVACLSERGELLILSLGGEVLTRIHLNLGNAPTRLQALQRYGRSCMVETSQEVLLVQQSGLDDAAVLRIRGLSGRSIRSTAYLPQGDGRIVIGYDDGSIEIHLVDTGGRTGVAHLRVHRSAVAALTLSRDANALASLADDGSIAVWRYPFSSPYAWIASQSSQATALCFAEGSRYVLSGHKDREIRLWELPAEDLSGHDDMVSLACETYPPSRGLFAIHRRSLWFSDFHHYYMVSRTGGMEQTARRQQDLHFIEAHACWSGPDGPLLLFPDFDKDEPEKAQSIRLVHWQVEGHVSAVDLTLHASRPTAWASHPDGQKFAIGYADGCLVEISAESGASINLTETADALKGVVSSRRGPRRVIWCRYGFEGRWLIAQYASRPHLVVIDRRSGVAFVLDQAGQHLDDVITGPVVLCGGDGGLIAMTAGSSAVHIAFDPEPQVTARRYEAVLRRVRSPDMPWTGVAVSPVGGWLVATRANLLVIWQLGAPSQARVVQTTERIVQMRFLPSSDRFVTVTADGNCQLWSAVSGQAIASLMRGAFRVEYLAQDASSLVVRLKNRYGALIELPTFRSTDSVRAKLIASRTSPGSW